MVLILMTLFLLFVYHQKESQRLSKRLIKGFERSVYWNEYKSKSENKNMTNKYRYLLESNFVRVKRLFILIYSTKMTFLKGINLEGLTYQKVLSTTIILSSIKRTFIPKPTRLI